MNGIIPAKYQRMEFDKVILQALEMVVSEGEVCIKLIIRIFYLSFYVFNCNFYIM